MMKRLFTTAVVAIVSFAAIAHLLAARPGGGGGAAPPAGTIYYLWSLDTVQSWEYRGDWAMSADGSQKQQLSDQNHFYSSGARLSHQMHGGARWLFDFGFNDATGNLALYAMPSDGGPSVFLADGADMTGSDDLWGAAVWGKDDSFISVVTFDWGDPAAYCQLYRAQVDFDTNGVPSVTSDWEWVTSGKVPGESDIDNCDWSRDGTRVALGMIPNDGVTPAHVVVYDTVLELDWVLAASGYNPRWSPTADRIAYKPFNQGVFAINSDGSELVQLTTGNGDVPQDWSPDGKHILFSRNGIKSVKGGYVVTVADVCYVSAAGGKAVNLTGDIDGVASARWWR